MSMLEQSEKVAPHLVKLYETQRLYGLAKDKGPEARMELADAITELLDIDLNYREKDLVAEVLISLLKQAERDLRQTLAERLAVMPNVPIRLLLHIAHDEIFVASSVLKHSTVLGDFDLLYIIKSQTPEYWRVIAQRAKMGPSVIDALADTKDIDTARNLAENSEIVLTNHAVNAISATVKEDENIALSLFRRKEVPQSVRAALYRYVSAELQNVIEQEFGMFKTEIGAGLQSAMEELIEDDFRNERPTTAMIHAAQRFMKAGKLTPMMMIKTLQHGQIMSFVAQFAIYTKMPTKTVQEILMQPCGQGLAMTCKAMKINKQDFISMYLLSQRYFSSANSNTGKESLNKAISYYDKVKESVAERILKGSQVTQ